MKKNILLTFIAAIIISGGAFSQGIFFEPSPTDVTAPVRLYVDITSAECNCPELADVDPVSNPLYIWTWNPNESRPELSIGGQSFDVTNGQWGSSNDNLQMTQDPDNPNLWYFDFLGASLVQFYNVPAAQFYASGIDFLVKEKNGAPADAPEQKSPNLNIIPEPIGCFEKICPFPTTFFQDEYFVITYDNSIENITSLQNLGEGEALIWFRYRVNGGSPIIFQDEALGVMNYEGDGLFSFPMIPEQFFGLSQGDQLTEIQVYITKPPINVPPFTAPISLFPGCPE